METCKCDSLNAYSETVVTRLMFMFALIAELTGRSCFKSVGQTCELCALIEVWKKSSCSTADELFYRPTVFQISRCATKSSRTVTKKHIWFADITVGCRNRIWLTANRLTLATSGNRGSQSYRLFSVWGSRTRSHNSRHTNGHFTHTAAIWRGELSGHTALSSRCSPHRSASTQHQSKHYKTHDFLNLYKIKVGQS